MVNVFLFFRFSYVIYYNLYSLPCVQTQYGLHVVIARHVVKVRLRGRPIERQTGNIMDWIRLSVEYILVLSQGMPMANGWSVHSCTPKYRLGNVINEDEYDRMDWILVMNLIRKCMYRNYISIGGFEEEKKLVSMNEYSSSLTCQYLVLRLSSIL